MALYVMGQNIAFIDDCAYISKDKKFRNMGMGRHYTLNIIKPILQKFIILDDASDEFTKILLAEIRIYNGGSKFPLAMENKNQITFHNECHN